MLTNALYRTDGSIERTLDILLARPEGKCERILGTTDEELTVTGRSTQTRFYLSILHLVETFPRHIVDECLNIAIALIIHAILLSIRCRITLHIQVDEHDRLFLILE